MVVAPPWKLHASGYAVLFSPVKENGRLSERFSPDTPIRFLGGFGLLLLLEYDRSGVGPYREALYIPGYASADVPCPPSDSGARTRKQTARPRRGHSITWIVVSTEDSRDSGIENWGIPKQLGAIEQLPGQTGDKAFLVTGERGERLLSVVIPRRGVRPLAVGPSLPLSSRLLPHTLIQAVGSTIYETHVEATGRFRTARRARVASYATQTAGIASRRVLATFMIAGVSIRFPPPLKY